MKVSLSAIKLIYPPISNRFADHLWENNQEVKEQLTDSHLYMLAQRQQLYFENYTYNDESASFNFTLVCGDLKYENLSVDLSEFLVEDDMRLEAGQQHIRIYPASVDVSAEEPTYWATTDKLLWDHSKKVITIQGDFDAKAISTFYLYYVGISKSNDSFTRLFKNGHKNRTKILSNEMQFASNARLSDELMIFFFDCEETMIKQYDLDESEFNSSYLNDKIDIISDAEKAFIKVLDCKYNTEKYKNYPQCLDGLYDKGLKSYSYHVDDDLIFIAPKATIKGSSNIFMEQDYDFILISGENVTLFKGQDIAEEQA
ncbi:hypothetical protein AB4543_05405 [Vibrio splendidus]